MPIADFEYGSGATALKNKINEISGVVNALLDVLCAVDAAATAGYIGATDGAGVVRADGTTIAKTDGGDFVTLGIPALGVDTAELAALAVTTAKIAALAVDHTKARMGDATDNMTWEADGTQVGTGAATWFGSVIQPGTAAGTPSNAPDYGAFGAAGSIEGYLFDGNATTEALTYEFELPRSYKEGSDIIFHAHWSAVNANAGNVVWQIEYTWADEDDTFPANTTISATDAASGTAWQNQEAAFSAITGTGFEIGSVIRARLFRDPTDGSDTYGSDAAFASLDLVYEQDTLGSRTATTK